MKSFLIILSVIWFIGSIYTFYGVVNDVEVKKELKERDMELEFIDFIVAAVASLLWPILILFP